MRTLAISKRLDRTYRSLFRCVCLAAVSAAAGAGVDLVPGLDVDRMYVDNINLTRDNTEADHITRIVPRLSLTSTGARSRTALDYEMQRLNYSDNDQFDESYQTARFLTRNELVSQSIFFDASASQTQVIIDPYDAGYSVVGDAGNITDQTAYTASPYWRQRFSGGSEARLIYSHSELEYDDTGDFLLNNRTDQVEAGYSTRGSQSPAYWGIDYSRSDIDYYDIGRTIELSEGSLSTGYRFGAAFGVGASAGAEKYTIEQDGVRVEFDDSVWDVGLTWNPARHVAVEARRGERFYGRTYVLKFDYTRDKRSWRFGYNEDVSTDSLYRSNRSPLTRTDEPGEPPEERAGRDGIYDPLQPSDSIFIEKVTFADIAQRFRRTVVGVRYERTERIFPEYGDSNEEAAKTEMRFSIDPGPYSTVELTAGRYRIIRGSGIGRSTGARPSVEGDVISDYRLRFEWKMSRKVSLVSSWEHATRESDLPENEYEQNIYTLGLSGRF